MRFLAMVVILLSGGLRAQRRPGISELEARIVALELEVRNLKAEIGRLRGLEERVKGLEASLLRLLGGESPASARLKTVEEGPATRPSGLTPFQAMPYGEDRAFLAVDLAERSTRRPDGRVEHRLLVDLVEITERLSKEPLAERKQEAEGLPPGYVALPLDEVQRLPRRRMIIEDLTAGGVKRWSELLAPRRSTGGAGPIFRQLSFARVLASRRQMLAGYKGNSGSIRVWRGEFYWDENNVFFLEDGVLKLLGEGAARHHLRFAGRPGMRDLRGR